jgi:hypothetical protein
MGDDPANRRQSEELRLAIELAPSTPASARAACPLVNQAGFTEVHTVERTWEAPLLFLAGRRTVQAIATE